MATIDNQTTLDLNALPSTERGQASVVNVPSVVATAESLQGYGRVVHTADPADVDIVTWPQTGRRPIIGGTGRGGGVVTGSFDILRQGGLLFAQNHAVARRYITGFYEDPATASAEREPAQTDWILTHEANYHPDGGQIFVPRDGASFVALLALPGDDVTPQDFVAFHCDGSFGIHIDAGVWHQPLYPTGDKITFDDAQGAVHACVGVDFVTEFGCYLKVTLAGR